MKCFPSFTAIALSSFIATGCSGAMSDAFTGTSAARSATVARDATYAASPGLYDNFESDALNGPGAAWTPASGTWSVCKIGYSSHEYCGAGSGELLSLTGNANWTDYTYDAYVVNADTAHASSSIVGRVLDASDYYEFGIGPDVNGASSWTLSRTVGGARTALATGPITPSANPYYHLRMVFLGSTIAAYVAQNFASAWTPLASVTDTTFSIGNVGVRATGATTMRFDNVDVSRAKAAPAGASAAPSAVPSANASATANATATPVAVAVATPSPVSVVAGLPTLPGLPNASMKATSADGFVATMGVDLDLTTPPDSAQAAIASAFAGLGVRHTRISILEDDAPYEANVNAFFAANPAVRAYGMTNCAPPLGGYPKAAIGPADVAAFQRKTGNRVDAIEGVNEPNGRSDANWVADTKSCVAPLTGAGPMLAPALIAKYGGDDTKALGTMGGGIAMANIHRYFAGRNPDTAGWGGTDACGTYGSLSWSTCWASVTAPNKPVVVTETGWNSDREVDESTQAKYVERVFFVNAQAGIAATSLYTFQSYAAGDGFGGDGIVRADLSPKPAYRAVANITQLLSDPGPAFSPAALPLQISPAPATGTGLRAMLLGKRDGSYDLALWQEVQSADPDHRGVDTVPAPVNVTVSIGGVRIATLHAWQDDGSAPASNLGPGASFTVPVSDRLSIVELR